MNKRYIDKMGEFIQTHSCLLASGGKSKTALRTPEGVTNLDLSGMSGVLDYEPSEYTFTALAGTPLKEVEQMLSANDQFLPFDPPLNQAGGTLGGTVAAGLSGPGRYRFGGIRDFVLGVRYLDGRGNLIRSGGKVVKNAAGFDIPKLMVGSLGSLGALVELSFKVFPKPEDYTTITSSYTSLGSALERLINLTVSPIEIICLDLEPVSNGYNLQVRLGGKHTLFNSRIERLKSELGDISIMDNNVESEYWQQINEFDWIQEGSTLVKVPITPKQVSDLDNFLSEHGSIRRYSVGANIAWIAWSKQLDILEDHFKESNLAGLTILGVTSQSHIGDWKSGIFSQRIKQALDPNGKWALV